MMDGLEGHAAGAICRTFFEEVPCYVTVQDRGWRILRANRRFREDFGPPPDDAPWRCYQVYKHRDEPCLACPVAATFADGQSHSSEEVATTRAGEHKDVLVVTAPVRNDKGEVDLVIEMSTDISETRRLQSQLANLGMMVGQIAHDVKGVLTGLDGGVYMVTTGMERHDRGRLEQGWEMVRRNVDRVRTLVLDILYYAKERELEYRLASPIRVVEDLVATFQPRARESGVEVLADLDPAAIAFEVDVRAVEAMLTNLLHNALDACRADSSDHAGQVRIGVRDEGEEVVFEVADNGVGMDRETRERAFTPFFSSKGGKGTGLGLYIAHRIATQHGGSIGLASSLGDGTTFTVHLPKGPMKPRRRA
jgi:signal transduction histidine kinase